METCEHFKQTPSQSFKNLEILKYLETMLFVDNYKF